MEIKIILAFCLLVAARSSFNPPFYLQSNASWENITLGFGPDTIGSAGCLMTSVTMMTAGEGVLFNGTVPDPPMMNEFLILNNGYVDGDLFLWASIEPLGFGFQGFLWTPIDIINAFQSENRVILNVMEGHHFVLMVGVGETYYEVQDPYFNRTTYFFQDVLRAGYYKYESL